jgi:hypothetical protein
VLGDLARGRKRRHLERVRQLLEFAALDVLGLELLASAGRWPRRGQGGFPILLGGFPIGYVS